MYPSLYSHFLIDSSVYWLGWLGILASHAPWLAPESVFALSLPSGGKYYAELWLLAALATSKVWLVASQLLPPFPPFPSCLFWELPGYSSLSERLFFPLWEFLLSSCFLWGKMHQVFFLMKTVSESPWIVVLLKSFLCCTRRLLEQNTVWHLESGQWLHWDN